MIPIISDSDQTLIPIFSDADQIVVSIDGSSNVHKCGVIVGIALIPKPVYLCCEEVKGLSKDKHFYANKYKDLITKVGTMKVVGTINDNENTMTASQKQLKEDYPSLINVGCLSHLLNLFAENGIQKCGTISHLIDLVKSTTTKIRSSSLLIGHFKAIQEKLAKKEGFLPVALTKAG